MMLNVGRLQRKWQQIWHLDDEVQIQLMQSTKWADGLRGIATLGVVASHLVLCFARSLARPCCGNDQVIPMLFQRPVLRLIASGHSWVAVFLVLLGFVNALKPVKQLRSGQTEAALSGLNTASFRRAFRLFLPCTLATSIAWFACQLGLMENARRSDAWWLYSNTPPPSPTWAQAIKDLFTALYRTWDFREGDVIYNQPQWTMVFLLEGSMLVFAALLVVARLTTIWRTVMLSMIALWSTNWSFVIGDPLVGFTCLAGIMLAEFSLSDTPAKLVQTRWCVFLAGWCRVTSLVLMSVPYDSADNAAWSKALTYFAQQYFPHASTGEIPRTWGSIGAVLLIIGIILSPRARFLLSAQPLLWLGKISFPVFLLHPSFMQTIMPLFAFSSEQTYEIRAIEGPLDTKGMPPVEQIYRFKQRGDIAIFSSIIITIACTCAASHLWIMKVEPVFGRLTAVCEDIMTGQKHITLPQVRQAQQENGHIVLNKKVGLLA